MDQQEPAAGGPLACRVKMSTPRGCRVAAAAEGYTKPPTRSIGSEEPAVGSFRADPYANRAGASRAVPFVRRPGPVNVNPCVYPATGESDSDEPLAPSALFRGEAPSIIAGNVQSPPTHLVYNPLAPQIALFLCRPSDQHIPGLSKDRSPGHTHFKRTTNHPMRKNART